MEAPEFIAPLHIACEIEARQLDIWPMTIGMVPQVLALVEPLLGELGLQVAAGMFDRLVLGEPTPADAVELASLLGRHGERMLGAVALLARTDRAWVEGLLPDRAVSLAARVIQVNADFFRQAIQPGNLAVLARALDRHSQSNQVSQAPAAR